MFCINVTLWQKKKPRRKVVAKRKEKKKKPQRNNISKIILFSSGFPLVTITLIKLLGSTYL
jgi:hypothetical protein